MIKNITYNKQLATNKQKKNCMIECDFLFDVSIIILHINRLVDVGRLRLLLINISGLVMKLYVQ